MGLIPGDTFKDCFTTSISGVLVQSSILPEIEVFHNGELDNSITVTTVVDPVIVGAYNYTFNVPNTWVQGDRISIFIAWEYQSKTNVQRQFLGAVEYPRIVLKNCLDTIKDILDFWGYTPGITATIDEQSGTITLSDGRQIQISVDIDGFKIIERTS